MPCTANYKHKRSSLDFIKQLWYITRIKLMLAFSTRDYDDGVSMWRGKKNCSRKRELCDGKAWAGAPRLFDLQVWSTVKWCLQLPRKLGPCEMNKRAENHWERWWDSFLECQPFDSELWYLGDVCSCILINIKEWFAVSGVLTLFWRKHGLFITNKHIPWVQSTLPFCLLKTIDESLLYAVCSLSYCIYFGLALCE